MLEHLYRLAAAAVAWYVGLRFVRVRVGPSAGFALGVGLLCGGASWGLELLAAQSWLLPAGQVLFVLAALLTLLFFRLGWGGAAHSLLLAQSAYAVLTLPLRSRQAAGSAVLLIGAGLCLGFLFLTEYLQDSFPERDLRGLFRRQEQDSRGPRWQQLYLIPAVMCLVLSAATVRFSLGSLTDCIWAGLTGSTVFWFGVWLMIALPAWQKTRSQVLTEQQYRGEMQSFLNVIRSQRHDYNFHVQTIGGLIRQGKVEDCLRYVNALEEDTAIMNAVLPIKDPAISAMIHNFRIQAVREGIQLHIEILYDLSQIATNVYETNKIISNLLQNAIDETARHEDKSYGIHLTILKRGEFCVIRVSNEMTVVPTAQQLGQIYQQGYTTKQGHDGVGLSSLKTLVSRYHGAIYTQMEGNIIHFIARVPIDSAKQPIE